MVDKRKVGGRPRYRLSIGGCPKHITDHIRTMAGPKYKCSVLLTPDRFLSPTVCALQDFVCGSCSNVLDEPVELPCKHLVCCSCCFNQLKSTDLTSFCCNTCKSDHPLTISSFGKTSPLTLKLLSQLMVHCDSSSCHGILLLGDLPKHIESKCTFSSSISRALTLKQVIEKPINDPPSQEEIKAAGHVVCKLLCQSSHTVTLPTGGNVSFNKI